MDTVRRPPTYSRRVETVHNNRERERESPANFLSNKLWFLTRHATVSILNDNFQISSFVYHKKLFNSYAPLSFLINFLHQRNKPASRVLRFSIRR